MYFMPASFAMRTTRRVELHRIELRRELRVFRHWDLRAIHDPLADAGTSAFLLAGRNRIRPQWMNRPYFARETSQSLAGWVAACCAAAA
jgi:hypothetical protein